MARVAGGHFGGETRHYQSEGMNAPATGMTFDTSIKRSGTTSIRFEASLQNFTRWDFAGTTAVRYFLTTWIYVPSASGLFTTASTRIVGMQTSGNTNLGYVRLNSDGTLSLVETTSTVVGSDSVATVTLDDWNRIDFGLEISSSAGTDDYIEGRLNGVTFATDTVNINTTGPGQILFGFVDDPGTSEVIYFDDFILNDDSGSDNNTWADDEERVLLSLPSADSANDGWQGGAGGTTNMYEAVNNIPPVGVDNGSATNTSQNECANSDVTDNYDATMQSYTTIGVGASDTVTAVYALVEGGNSSTTGANTIGLSVISNPAIAEASIDIDVNDGTYPTGWNHGITAVAEMPSVTLGTSPVVSVRKGVATTRVAAVCLMGLYVSYIAAPPAPSERGPQIIWIM